MEKLRFEAGKPLEFALKFANGKNVEGKFGTQVLFTTTDDSVFYLDPEPASDIERQIVALGIKAREPIRVTKTKTTHGGHSWSVERVARRDAGGHNVPESNVRTGSPEELEALLEKSIERALAARSGAGTALTAPAPGTATTTQPNGTAVGRITLVPPPAEPAANVSTKFMAAYAAAIDTLIEARIYAQRKGLALEIRCEDVRCLAATIMIDQKGGAR